MDLSKKSRGASFLLTLLLGPLGLLYSSVVAGVILLVIAIASAVTVIGPILCWLMSIVLGDHYVHKHNKNIEEFKDLMVAKQVE